LVRVLLGLEKPDRGAVQRRKDLRIGYVPQRFDSDAVIPMTVERFLMLGSAVTLGDIEAALAHVDAQSVRNQQLGELSGGELQRVLLARALLRKPNLLVLDEPVQGVDYTGEADLYNLIGRLRDEVGFGVLLVSHDLHIVMARSDRVICLNHHVCCSGVPETVAQHPAYGRLFGPDAARAFAVYRHQHDHSHDLAGMPHPGPDETAAHPARGDK
jgi:zinc transport system ATP-binding protein